MAPSKRVVQLNDKQVGTLQAFIAAAQKAEAERNAIQRDARAYLAAIADFNDVPTELSQMDLNLSKQLVTFSRPEQPQLYLAEGGGEDAADEDRPEDSTDAG